MRRAFGDVFEALVPAPCLECGGAGGPICEQCRIALSGELRPRPAEVSSHALRLPLGADAEPPPAWAGGAYRGLPARAMLAFKAGTATVLASDIAGFLVAALEASGAGEGDVIVPVPTSRRAFMRRGFDPVDEILRRADVASRFTGCRIERAVARRPGPARWRLPEPSGRSGGQKGLGTRDRAQRTAAAFAPARSAEASLRSARRILVVDDVLTTGATAAGVLRTLETVGCDNLGVVVALAAKGTGVVPYDKDRK